MKRFKFPLESLRVLRKQKERAAQQRYARALAVCKKAEISIAKRGRELEAGWSSLGGELNASVAASRLCICARGARCWKSAGTNARPRWRKRGAWPNWRFRKWSPPCATARGWTVFTTRRCSRTTGKSSARSRKILTKWPCNPAQSRGLLQLAGLKKFIEHDPNSSIFLVRRHHWLRACIWRRRSSF